MQNAERSHRELTLLLAAETGLDPRTAARVIEGGIGVLKARVDRERARVAVKQLGICLPVGEPK